MRIAHFIPDALAIDVCLKPDGTAAFSGKFVQEGGLNFASASTRSSLDAGTYSLRIVSASATDCNTSLNGLGDIGGVAVDGDSAVTLGLVGLLSGTGSRQRGGERPSSMTRRRRRAPGSSCASSTSPPSSGRWTSEPSPATASLR